MRESITQNEPSVLEARPTAPDVPRSAVVVLILWSVVEGTVFAFAVRPTISDLLSDLIGFSINPTALVLLLTAFCTVIVAGSFACLQVLKDAIDAKRIGDIFFMTLVQVSIALFQVLFLYRNLIDASAPWLAQQGVALGRVGTLGLASLAWISVRGMTWFLFARAGAAALVPFLGSSAGRSR